MDETEKAKNRENRDKFFQASINAGNSYVFCSHLESGEERVERSQWIPTGDRHNFVLCRFCWGNVIRTVLDRYVVKQMMEG